jgi:hypothetical protein
VQYELVHLSTSNGFSYRETITTHLFDLLIATPYSLTLKQAAEVLTEIGGAAVITRLLRLLADEQVDTSLRVCIAAVLGTLGECSVIADLVRLLADEQVDRNVHGSIAPSRSYPTVGMGMGSRGQAQGPLPTTPPPLAPTGPRPRSSPTVEV